MYPSPLDANPYAYLANLAGAPQVRLSASALMSRLSSELPVPLFRSTFQVGCLSSYSLRAVIDAQGTGDGPWWVGPSATPAGAGDVLDDAGLELVDEVAMMSAPLDAGHTTAAPPAGVSLAEVHSNADLADWAAAYAGGHGHPPDVERAWYDVLAALGTDAGGRLRHFVARVDGRPAASASVFFAAGVAGLYSVATPPAFRGRGIGTAITRAALAAAERAGYGTAVLGAEPAAARLYRRIGFRDAGVMRVYA